MLLLLKRLGMKTRVLNSDILEDIVSYLYEKLLEFTKINLTLFCETFLFIHIYLTDNIWLKQ